MDGVSVPDLLNALSTKGAFRAGSSEDPASQPAQHRGASGQPREKVTSLMAAGQGSGRKEFRREGA